VGFASADQIQSGWFDSIERHRRAPHRSQFVYPVRVNRSHKRAIGWHQSLINETSNPFHSELERQAMLWLDLVPSVRSFTSQSKSFSYDFGIRECSSTPDIRAELLSGATWFIEVKPKSFYEDAENVERACAIADAIRATGDEYLIFTDEYLNREPRKANIARLQLYRHIEPDPETNLLIYMQLTRFSASTVGELARLSGDRVLGYQTVMSLVLRRRLSIDLQAAITPTSPVRLTANQKGRL